MTVLDIAVGVVKNTDGQILIAKRPKGKDFADFWEFPGGKIETEENVWQALQREFKEEVNLQLISGRELIQIPWDYPGKQVLLHVYLVDQFDGLAEGQEGQELKWIDIRDLQNYIFPPANKAIVNSLKLPNCILITGEEIETDIFEKKINTAVKNGINCIVVRADSLSKDQYCNRITCTRALEKGIPEVKFIYSTQMLPLDTLVKLGVKNVHLKSALLDQVLSESQLEAFEFVSAAVHNSAELARANALNLDLVFCSPISNTLSHPNAKPLGWAGLKKITYQAKMPVFALGGVSLSDLEMAHSAGAQGVAGISAFWP